MEHEVSKNILQYMNAHSAKKEYKLIDVRIISITIKEEMKQRSAQSIKLRSRTKEGKKIINTRICDIANKVYKRNYKIEDIILFKKCRMEEYEDRTHKCSWGFPDVRERYGFNPITGVEEGDL